jgi:accessory gene regulator protein AgrB
MKTYDPIEHDAHVRHRRVKVVITLLVLMGVALLLWGLYRAAAPRVFLAAFAFAFAHGLVKAVFGKGSR